jgi:transcriptional regulator with XRE-family HTH domain
MSKRMNKPDAVSQDPHALSGDRHNKLEAAIGREIRGFRQKQNMTVVDLANRASLSAGMLSKIENGNAAPSLGTLQALSAALHVPVTAFFRRYEESREASHVKSGKGLQIERRGTRAGHQYELLGHTTSGAVVVEPYLITLSEESDVFPLFQHAGTEFLYMLEGEVDYRHNDRVYNLAPGDSLYFSADAPHGPETLIRLPIRFLSIIAYVRDND